MVVAEVADKVQIQLSQPDNTSQSIKQTRLDGCFLSQEPGPNHRGASGETLDVATLCFEIRADVKSMNSKFDTLSNTVNQLQVEIRLLKEQNDRLRSQVSSMADKQNYTENCLAEQSFKQENSMDLKVM